MTNIPSVSPWLCRLILLAFCILDGGYAFAHPHVFVETSTTLVFDADGRLIELNNTWIFDDFYSSFVTLGIGERGKPASEAQLRPIAETNIESLSGFGWFTTATIDGVPLQFIRPSVYQLTQNDERKLVFTFALPLQKPQAISRDFELQIFDPSYYVAFEVAASDPARLSNAPPDCRLEVTRPGAVTPEEAAKIQAAKRFDTPFSADFSARLTSRTQLRCGSVSKGP